MDSADQIEVQFIDGRSEHGITFAQSEQRLGPDGFGGHPAGLRLFHRLGWEELHTGEPDQMDGEGGGEVLGFRGEVLEGAKVLDLK